MKKKLIDLLSSMDETMEIKIGAVNGTGWFYFGSVGDFKEKIDEFDEKFHTDVEKALADASTSIESLRGKMNELEAKKLKACNDEDLRYWTDRLEEAETSFPNAVIRRRVNRGILAKWVHLGERIVRDNYISPIYGENCIVIDGREIGVWTKKELEK